MPMATVHKPDTLRWTQLIADKTNPYHSETLPRALSLKEYPDITYQGCKTSRIQLAEEHEVVRSAIRHLLESEDDIEVVAESADGEQACWDYDRCKPDALVMGLSLPGMNGLEVIRRILSRYPEARILILSMYSGHIAITALELGARGFISKGCSSRDLIMAIRKVIRGGHYVEPGLASQLAWKKGEKVKALLSSLTKRELEVFKLLADGQSVTSISKQMHLSGKTIYTHRERILRKLGVNSVALLTKIAILLDIDTQNQP